MSTTSPAGRRPELDGLRGLAVTLVVAHHVGIGYGGIPGVTMFFVLSGYLITGVIRDSHRAGTWSYWRFAGNRCARLAPALALMVLVCTGLWLATGRPAGVIAELDLTVLLYLEDFVHGIHDETIYVHTWSLAVEEQFYLLWPLAVPALLAVRRRNAAVALAVLIGASLAARAGFTIAGLYSFAYANITTNAFALLTGCALVVLRVKLPARVPVWSVAITATGGIAAVTAAAPIMPANLGTIPLATALLTAPLILALNSRTLIYSHSVTRFLGRTSYAWYLWHWPLLWLTGTNGDPLGGGAIAIAALAVATASTLLVEEPVRRWWRHRQPPIVSLPTPQPVALHRRRAPARPRPRARRHLGAR